MGAINDRDFNDPISRRLARGESLGTQNQLWLDPLGHDTVPIRNGGILDPVRYEIPNGARLYRFASTKHRVERTMAGGWWLERRELDQLIRFAQVNGHTLGYAVRLLCCVPPEWGSALNFLVGVDAAGPLLAWRGLANSAFAKYEGKPGTPRAAEGVTRIDARNDVAALRVPQLFIPGTQQEGGPRAMFRFIGEWQTEGALDWIFGSGNG